MKSQKVWVLNPPFLPKFSRSQRSPAVTKSGTIYFPIWLAYCVGVLEQAGHEVTFTDAPVHNLDREQAVAIADRLQPSLVVMDTSTPSIENDLQVAARIKEVLKDAFIVLVGTHVSALPEETLQNCPAVDAVARREYDYTIRELAEILANASETRPTEEALAGINGMSFRVDDRIIHNPDRPLIEDLDQLPWVSRIYKQHLDINDYFNPNALYPMVTLITSRGCPYKCNFCVYPQTITGRKYRFRSIQDVVNEIQFVAETFPEAKSVFFEDDTLTANKKRCIEFANALLAENTRMPWTANSRIELDFETMSLMKAAGCRQLCVGFESGDQQVLESMKKGTKVDRMFQFMADARKTGLLIHGCFMFGFPGETRESIMRTIELAIRLRPDAAQFYPVMVYPGTEAYDEYKERGWLTAGSYSDWLTPDGLHNCVIRNEHLTAPDLVRLCDYARRRFYLRPGYMAYKAGQVIRHPRELRRTAKGAAVFLKHLVTGSRV